VTNQPTEDRPSIVLIVDDEKREALHASRHLRRALPQANLTYVLRTPDDVGSEANYVDLVDTLPVSAILIDQRLGETSNVPYNGLQLARTLREVRPMLPIFILTKWAPEDGLEAQGFAVDDVMSKPILRDKPDAYVGRLLRAMKRYEEARSTQSHRMHELVARSLTEELNADETDELIKLRADIGIGTLGREVELAHDTRQRLDHKKDILSVLDALIQENKDQ